MLKAAPFDLALFQSSVIEVVKAIDTAFPLRLNNAFCSRLIRCRLPGEDLDQTTQVRENLEDARLESFNQRELASKLRKYLAAWKFQDRLEEMRNLNRYANDQIKEGHIQELLCQPLQNFRPLQQTTLKDCVEIVKVITPILVKAISEDRIKLPLHPVSFGYIAFTITQRSVLSFCSDDEQVDNTQT